MKNDTTFKVYVDGKLNYRATYLPVLKRKLASAGWAFNDKFYELSQR